MELAVASDGTVFFIKDGAKGRPRIYAMGCRNPWRMTVDQETGFVYWDEVSSDAGACDFFDAQQPIRCELFVKDAEDGTNDDYEMDVNNVAAIDPDSPGRVSVNAVFASGPLPSPNAKAASKDDGPTGRRSDESGFNSFSAIVRTHTHSAKDHSGSGRLSFGNEFSEPCRRKLRTAGWRLGP